MSSEVNVELWAVGTLGPAEIVNWFWDIDPRDYAQTIKRVRTFSAVPFVETPPPGEGLDIPPDPPYPTFEQRIEITDVFHLLKGTPTPPPGQVPANAPALQVNLIVKNLSDINPVAYHIYMAETNN
jgi:hypothetical protein